MTPGYAELAGVAGVVDEAVADAAADTADAGPDGAETWA